MQLKAKYNDEIKKELMTELGFKSTMEIPKVEKIVINMGLGQAVGNAKIIDEAYEELKLITGQAPLITKSKKSIATYKLREDMPIGLKVTLRGDVMYNFLEKLYSIVLPRVRDFKGIPDTSFDGHGNYTLGIKEQYIFPEIEFDKVNIVKGMDITIVTTAKTDEHGKILLKKMGLPLGKEGDDK